MTATFKNRCPRALDVADVGVAAVAATAGVLSAFAGAAAGLLVCMVYFDRNHGIPACTIADAGPCINRGADYPWDGTPADKAKHYDAAGHHSCAVRVGRCVRSCRH